MKLWGEVTARGSRSSRIWQFVLVLGSRLKARSFSEERFRMTKAERRI